MDEMAGWHLRLNGHALEQILGDSEGQGSLACCSPFECCQALDMTWRLNNNNNTIPALVPIGCWVGLMNPTQLISYWG